MSDLDDRINALLNFNIKYEKKDTNTYTNQNGQRPLIIQNLQFIANWEGIEVVTLVHVYEAHKGRFQPPLSGAAIALHSHASGASCLSGHLCHLQLSAPTCSVQDAQGRKMELPDYFVKFWKDYYDQSIG